MNYKYTNVNVQSGKEVSSEKTGKTCTNFFLCKTRVIRR
jgi:hypothetical protein